MIVFPAQRDVLMIPSNNSNTLGNTVNKYQNSSIMWVMYKWQKKYFIKKF